SRSPAPSQQHRRECDQREGCRFGNVSVSNPTAEIRIRPDTLHVRSGLVGAVSAAGAGEVEVGGHQVWNTGDGVAHAIERVEPIGWRGDVEIDFEIVVAGAGGAVASDDDRWRSKHAVDCRWGRKYKRIWIQRRIEIERNLADEFA